MGTVELFDRNITSETVPQIDIAYTSTATLRTSGLTLTNYLSGSVQLDMTCSGNISSVAILAQGSQIAQNNFTCGKSLTLGKGEELAIVMYSTSGASAASIKGEVIAPTPSTSAGWFT